MFYLYLLLPHTKYETGTVKPEDNSKYAEQLYAPSNPRNLTDETLDEVLTLTEVL